MTERNILFETRETREQEEAASRHLGDLDRRLSALAERWAVYPRPGTGSELSAVDALNPYEPLSQQIHNFVTVGMDNARATIAHIKKTGEIPLMALYAMIRSSIEASSFGLWLSHAGTKNKKAWLGLRLSYQNNEDLGGLERVWDASAKDFPALEAVRKKLTGYQHAIGNYRNLSI